MSLAAELFRFSLDVVAATPRGRLLGVGRNRLPFVAAGRPVTAVAVLAGDWYMRLESSGLATLAGL